DVFFLKNYPDILEGVIVSGHRNIIEIQSPHLIILKISLSEGSCNFPRTICAEIKTHYHIARSNSTEWFTGCINTDYRFHKLIRDPKSVRLLNRLLQIGPGCT